MLNLSLSDLLQLIAILGLVAAVVYGILKFVSDFFQSITNSSAMIAFGFKQINIKQGVLHPNTATEVEIHDEYMSTSWNELEVGMGLMNKLPILLDKDKDIDSGVFDSKLSEAFVATITADYNSRELEYNQILKNWLSTF